MQGTIDMKNVYQLFDSIAMLHGSPHWTSTDVSKMHAWMVEYVAYLTSEHVAPERSSINNHGTYFDLQYVSVLRFLGRQNEARDYINTAGKERLRLQVWSSCVRHGVAINPSHRWRG
jgi:Alginate lyase